MRRSRPDSLERQLDLGAATGAGFDPDAVPEDRQGVRESIIGRMERHGGRAAVRAGAGGGTEVELSLERVRA